LPFENGPVGPETGARDEAPFRFAVETASSSSAVPKGPSPSVSSGPTRFTDSIRRCQWPFGGRRFQRPFSQRRHCPQRGRLECSCHLIAQRPQPSNTRPKDHKYQRRARISTWRLFRILSNLFPRWSPHAHKDDFWDVQSVDSRLVDILDLAFFALGLLAFFALGLFCSWPLGNRVATAVQAASTGPLSGPLIRRPSPPFWGRALFWTRAFWSRAF